VNVAAYDSGDEDALAPPRMTLVSWLAADGEFVQINQAICQIETADAYADVPAWANGYLRHNASPGDRVRFDDGEPFAMIEVR
jgi:pyruvate/2-oxoglutarate dehydrogenase complex dihydrolipoamide acyltransferase (E2) component